MLHTASLAASLMSSIATRIQKYLAYRFSLPTTATPTVYSSSPLSISGDIHVATTQRSRDRSSFRCPFAFVQVSTNTYPSQPQTTPISSVCLEFLYASPSHHRHVLMYPPVNVSIHAIALISVYMPYRASITALRYMSSENRRGQRCVSLLPTVEVASRSCDRFRWVLSSSCMAATSCSATSGTSLHGLSSIRLPPIASPASTPSSVSCVSATEMRDVVTTDDFAVHSQGCILRL